MKFPGLRIGTTVDHAVGTLTTRQYPNSGDYSNYDDGYISFWYTKVRLCKNLPVDHPSTRVN